MIEFIEEGLARVLAHKEKYHLTSYGHNWTTYVEEEKFTKADELLHNAIAVNTNDFIDIVCTLADIRLMFNNNAVFKRWLQTVPNYKLLIDQCAPYVLNDNVHSRFWYDRCKHQADWLKVQRASV